MAHFAKVENGIVTNVIVVDNAHEANGEEYLHSLGLDGKWVQTSYNGKIRGMFAGIGCIYDEADDTFKPKKSNDNAVWDSASWSWIVPSSEENN